MRWVPKTKPAKKNGDIRIKKRFLFIPKHELGEVRWLEIATWEEMWVEQYGYVYASYWEGWVFTKWI